MSYLGDLRLGDTIDFKFTTVQTAGSPFTLAGSPVISAYPANSTTQLTAGITLTVDFDSVTGLNHVRVVASGGNGYLTATNYEMVITTGTVNSVSVVGYVVGTFSIENRSAVMPTTAARTLDVSATGEAGVDWANVGSPTTSLALTGTTIATTQKVDIETIKTNPVVNGGTITFPTTATLASTTNITAATGIDVTKWSGTTVTAPNTAGTPVVDVGRINNVSTSAVTAVKAIQGLTTLDTIVTVSGNVNGSVGSVTGSVGSVTGSVGSVTGAVGSVTGAVGSVTGNVGGNVVGSVASVTGNVGGNVVGSAASVVGAVGSVTGNVGGNVVGSVASVTAAVAITSNVKKNQALSSFEFLMTDSTTHNPATGKAVTVTRSIDGGAFAAGTLSAVTEISNGIYAVNFGAGDLNGNVVTLRATAASSDDTFERIETQP